MRGAQGRRVTLAAHRCARKLIPEGDITNAVDASMQETRAALLELTAAQQVALELHASGRTHATAGEAAGVTRETVCRWAGHHPGFRAALAKYRAALAAEQALRRGSPPTARSAAAEDSSCPVSKSYPTPWGAGYRVV